MERKTCRCYQIFSHKYGLPASLATAYKATLRQGILGANLNIPHPRSHVSRG
jgi:hypothetical protein